ncbi:WhiB family transcriptional regulator [Streptomyces sp. NPDC053560]|uniref:WhiB family transcriptional regulator n=1 Tax=Streptomyces sp. NPDC053560 TaxID=3365711 RepID=UPI0037D593B7
MARRSRPAPDNLPRPYHWSDDAACRGIPTAVFFPAGKGGVPMKIESAYAKSFCTGCPVIASCLTHALTNREDFGVWGGLDEDERAEMVRQARLEAERRRRREREQARGKAVA